MNYLTGQNGHNFKMNRTNRKPENCIGICKKQKSFGFGLGRGNKKEEKTIKFNSFRKFSN